MKKIITTSLLMTMALLMVQAQPRRFEFKKNPEVRYALKVGKSTMEIDAANGARVMSLKYDTIEVLSQINFPNQYGSTFWTSPQKEWNWPPVYEHDMAPYEVTQNEDGSVLMVSPLSEKFPMRISKLFAVDAKINGFVITYTIKNESAVARKVAPWEITRVPQEGTICFEADPAKITGANGMERIDFVKNADGWAQYDIEKKPVNRKVNADGAGWLTYVNKGIVLTKRFPDLKPGEEAPAEAEIQIYADQGGQYVELEEQGRYVELQPGESMSWSVQWHVAPINP